MKVPELVERMTLDLMVKGTIDSAELRPSFAALSEEVSDLKGMKGLLSELDDLLNTAPDSPELSSPFERVLSILEEIGGLTDVEEAEGISESSDSEGGSVVENSDLILELIERMTLDLMVKGSIDSGNLRTTFDNLSEASKEIIRLDPQITELHELLNTAPDSADHGDRFERILVVLEEMGTLLKPTSSVDDFVPAKDSVEVSNPDVILELLERMVLDLMVKGVIDSSELRPSFERLSAELSAASGMKQLLGELKKFLNTSSDSPEMGARYQKMLEILEEISNCIKPEKPKAQKDTNVVEAAGAEEEEIPKKLVFNAKTDPEIVESFQLEVSELLEKLEHDLLVLERSRSGLDLIRTVMGYLHSIKGIAGFLELVSLQKLAHIAESALEVGLSSKEVSSDTCDALLRMKDMCTVLVDSVLTHYKGKKRSFSKLPATYRFLYKELVSLSKGESTSEPVSDDVESLGLSSTFSSSLSEVKEVKEEPMVAPVDEVLEQSYEEYTEEDLERVFGNLIVEAEEVANGQTLAGDLEEENQAESPNRGVDSSEQVRIKLAKLEGLLDLVGEVVVAHVQAVHDPRIVGIEDLDFQKKLTHLSKCTRSLQAVGMSLRLFPVQQVFTPLSRTARDLGQRLNKKVEVIREGEDAELDKSILNALSDPLMHMVRNAVDHGLESESDRRKAGKKVRGEIRLRASSQGGRIRIEVGDDGRGLDRAVIVKKAQKLGLIKDDAGMSDESVYQLIFSSGFSTRSEVSEISGRGVGMDIVKRSIDRLGGQIEVKSRIGHGTLFTLTLPLTLAMIEGLVVHVREERYIIPSSMVGEVVRARSEQINTVHGHGEMLSLRGKNLPLIRLDEFLGSRVESETNVGSLALVIKGVENPFALIVDSVSGQQQVVLKGLGDALASQRGVSGCAILGDGCVSLVLNPEEVSEFILGTTVHEIA